VVSSIARRAVTWRFVSRELLELLTRNVDHDLAERVRALAVVAPPILEMPDVDARARVLRAELGAFQVSVGRLIASKRVDKAIDHAVAARSLLVVVGEGPERRTLERHAARSSARVRFVGDVPRSEALAYLAAADSLVFTSEAEGCSTVVREAAATGTPVIMPTA
jgi:teichuronic acid biosynthesis glycosyltransferase TuaC